MSEDETYEYLNGKFLQANKLYYTLNPQKACDKFRDLIEIIEEIDKHIKLPSKVFLEVK